MVIEPWQWALGWLGALLIGLGKSGLPGVGNLTIIIYAFIFPLKESIGVLLVVLICTDLVVVTIYWREARWKYLRRLSPWTAAGIVAGYFTLGRIDPAALRVLIGTILLGLASAHFAWKYKVRKTESPSLDLFAHHPSYIALTGILGGFSTMVANAAGPVAALYFLSIGLKKLAFVGTIAWFFFLANLFKLPFQVSLHILNPKTLNLGLAMVPASLLGASLGPYILRRINQRAFEWLIWLFILFGGLKLLI